MKRTHDDLTDKEKEKKKKKGEKWMASQQAKAEDARGKQNDWQKFGKKAAKKGIHIAGLEGKSVFRTNNNPAGRGELSGVVRLELALTSHSRCRWLWKGHDRLRAHGQAQVRPVA